MNDNYRRAEDAILDAIAAEINHAEAHGYLYDLIDDWGEVAIAIALSRLADAWERRVQIAEATARQKGINP